MKTFSGLLTKPFPKWSLRWPSRLVLAMILAGIITSAAYGIVRVAEYLVVYQTTEFFFAVGLITIVVLMDMKLHTQVERLKEEKLDDKIRDRFTRFADDFVADINSTPLLGAVLVDPDTLPDLGGSIGQSGQPSEPGDAAYDSGYYAKLRAESTERSLNGDSFTGKVSAAEEFFTGMDLYGSDTPTAQYRSPGVLDSRRVDDHADDEPLRGYVSEG